MQESGLTKIIPFMCISAILSVLLSVYNCDIQKSGGTSLQHHPPTFYCHVTNSWVQQEYWSRQPFPSPGALPNPGIEQVSGIVGRFFTGWATRAENQRSQIKEFSAFLHMGRCKSLGLPNSLLSCASQLSWASILCFSHPELPWGSPWGVTAVLGAARWQVFTAFLRSSPWRAAITDDCDILVYWYGREYSNSQSLPLVRNLINMWETFHDNCPTVLRGSSQIRPKFSLICHSRC